MYKPLRNKTREYINTESGTVISKRQYDRIRRGGITNEAFALSKKHPMAGKYTTKELTEMYKKQYYSDYGKAISDKEARKNMVGIRKRLASKDQDIRIHAELQMQEREYRAQYYMRLIGLVA